jgi:hypothetical protein
MIVVSVSSRPDDVGETYKAIDCVSQIPIRRVRPIPLTVLVGSSGFVPVNAAAYGNGSAWVGRPRSSAVLWSETLHYYPDSRLGGARSEFGGNERLVDQATSIAGLISEA